MTVHAGLTISLTYHHCDDDRDDNDELAGTAMSYISSAAVTGRTLVDRIRRAVNCKRS